MKTSDTSYSTRKGDENLRGSTDGPNPPLLFSSHEDLLGLTSSCSQTERHDFRHLSVKTLTYSPVLHRPSLEMTGSLE